MESEAFIKYFFNKRAFLDEGRFIENTIFSSEFRTIPLKHFDPSDNCMSHSGIVFQKHYKPINQILIYCVEVVHFNTKPQN